MHSAFFSSALLVQHWFERKKDALVSGEQKGRKTSIGLHCHCCTPLRLSSPAPALMQALVATKRSGKEKEGEARSRHFVSETASSLQDLVVPREQPSPFSGPGLGAKRKISQPLKEHLVALEWLELALSDWRPSSTKSHAITPFLPQQKKEVAPQEWPKARGDRVDRVMGHLIQSP